MTPSTERRTQPRFPVHLAISFWGDEVVGEGTSINLSTGGCKVKSDKTIPEGRYLELNVHLPGVGSPMGVGLAVVRWTEHDTFGLEFLYMTPEQHEQLVWFVHTLHSHAGATRRYTGNVAV